MVLYLDLAHRQLQKGREVVILSRDYPLVADWAYPIELYQLIDFLQNVELLKQVGYALRGCISFTPRQMCTVDAEDATIDRILEAFEMLDVNHQYQARFRDNIISAFCKQCDWDFLVDHHKTLESHPEFLAKLSLEQDKYIASIRNRIDPKIWFFGEVPVSNHQNLEAHPELLAEFSLTQARYVASIMDQIYRKPSSSENCLECGRRRLRYGLYYRKLRIIREDLSPCKWHVSHIHAFITSPGKWCRCTNF